MREVAKTVSRPRRIADEAWHYVEVHHSDFGVALFVVPMLVVALLFVEAGCLLSWLVR